MSDGIELSKKAKCIKEREKSILVSASDFKDEPFWIPSSDSVIHPDSDTYKEGTLGTLIVYEWFAERKGWV